MDLFILCVAYLTEFFGVVVILLLNVMELLSVSGGALLDRPCIVFPKVCVFCACDSNGHLDASSIGFVCVCRKISPHLRV